MNKKYILGCTGHINLLRIQNLNEEELRERIRNYIRSLLKDYAVELYCGLAYGADSLFAEEALSCGVKVYAVLPCQEEEFAAEQPDGGKLFNRLINEAEEVIRAQDACQR